jgi:hypothetical protein
MCITNVQAAVKIHEWIGRWQNEKYRTDCPTKTCCSARPGPDLSVDALAPYAASSEYVGHRSGAADMRVWLLLTIVFGLLGSLDTTAARAQDSQRPPVGGISSSADAMIFYVAHGVEGACGPGCSDWIAAEGTVQWDTHKRLIAILDRLGHSKLPVAIHSWGAANLNVVTGLGRILRDRGVNATVGKTDVDACAGKTEPNCFALKRRGGPLDATLKTADIVCDLACVMTLVGGVHRTLPPGSAVRLGGIEIQNRLAKVNDDRVQSLEARFGQLYRIYLRNMGVPTELLDIVDRNSQLRRQTDLPESEWFRLRIVTEASL